MCTSWARILNNAHACTARVRRSLAYLACGKMPMAKLLLQLLLVASCQVESAGRPEPSEFRTGKRAVRPGEAAQARAVRSMAPPDDHAGRLRFCLVE